METRERFGLGQLTTVCTLAALGLVLLIAGQQMFSPGPLNADNRTSAVRGGVHAHAEIGQCSACHAPPWSQGTMSERCLDCHAEVRTQIAGHGPLHGLIADAANCRHCHSEHHGRHGPLTSFAGFDHDWTAFKLTGKHVSTACRSCHSSAAYKGTPTTCLSCHAEPKEHLGRFGTDCGKCHSTDTWLGATFEHKFPLNHGVGKRNTSSCSVCHKTPDFTTYTCYGCHRHNAAKTEQKHLKDWLATLANVNRCAECHAMGRKHRNKGGKVGLVPGCPEQLCSFALQPIDLPDLHSPRDELAAQILQALQSQPGSRE